MEGAGREHSNGQRGGVETGGSERVPKTKFSRGQGWDSGRRAGVRRGQGGQGGRGGTGVGKMEGAGKEHSNG